MGYSVQHVIRRTGETTVFTGLGVPGPHAVTTQSVADEGLVQGACRV